MERNIKSDRVAALGALRPNAAPAGLPAISGKAVIDAPALLDWPYDGGLVQPNLNDPTSNTVHDLHARITDCDLVLSTEGNYHPALQEYWPIFLASFGDRPLANWVYSTSPPVVISQRKNGILQVGNVYVECPPSLAVANHSVVNALVAGRSVEGSPIPLYQDRGEVILVKKGNPKNIHTIWDLGRKDVRFVTPNPALESGAFTTYAAAIHGIARHTETPAEGRTADGLFRALFADPDSAAQKWLIGPRIHPRDVPWSIAHGRADASVIYYHLALYTKQSFPDLFDIVPLGGDEFDPRPLAGTPIGLRYVVALEGRWTARQREARSALLEGLCSPDFAAILTRRGLIPQAPGMKTDDQA
jgi:hypothetical protein